MITKRLLMPALALAAVCAFSVSCDKNPLQPPLYNDVAPEDQPVPTEDQMEVSMNAGLSAAVLSQFEEGSTGAALVRRLPGFSTDLTRDTKLIVLKGSDIVEGSTLLSGDKLRQLVQVYLGGGCILVEKPTGNQLQVLSDALMDGLSALQSEEWDSRFGLETPITQDRMDTRLINLRNCATRAGVEGADETAAEMVILGPTEYFYQEPFDTAPRVATYAIDENGNHVLGSTLDGAVEQNGYQTGVLADAAARWLNDLGGNRREQASVARQLAATRADGAGAINSLMTASETFTHNSMFLERTSSNLVSYAGNIVTTFRSWGVHNLAEDRDFYYIRQSVLLQAADLFDGVKNYDDNVWRVATGYGDFNRWYGSFLSGYVTSMDLVGNSGIKLEEALPYTDNSNSIVNVTCGQSSSNTETLGCSWSTGAGASMSGPSININWGGSYSLGHTEGSSFSMGYSKNYKDLSVKKNTDGSCVTWTYEGHLPQYREEHRDGYIYYCHEKPGDILVNDANLDNEICWSVGSPSGSYMLRATMRPETAALLYARGGENSTNKKHRYEFTTNVEDKDFSYQLLQPNRSVQNWRMYVTIDEWEGTPVTGALGSLEENLVSAFPNEFRRAFSIADKTSTSLQVINANIHHAKEVFAAHDAMLLNYAQSWGIKQYTIHWACDDTQNVHLKDSYVVAVVHHTPYKLKAVSGSQTDSNEGFAKVLDDNFNTKWRVERKDSDTAQQEYVVEFTSEEPILPRTFFIVMGNDIEDHPDNAPYRCLLYGWVPETETWSYLGGITDWDGVLKKNGSHLEGTVAPAIHDKKFSRFRFRVKQDWRGAYDVLEMNELVLLD